MKVKAWVETLIQAAMKEKAEDIHLFPRLESYVIYFRVNGVLRRYQELTLDLGERVIRYLKYVSDMDVGERRLPQDGSLVLKVSEGEIELRLSTMTNYRFQESLVIRLLYSHVEGRQEIHSIDTASWQVLFDYCHKKCGLLIFSGPVSSGKTTTIYRLLSALYKEKPYSILTMEDPVEIKDPRFLQAEVNEAGGVTYERLIRSSLRHHPDILVIGEIRDEETARMVMRAALTGHLVIATIHARDCLGVIGRLEELGVSREQLLQTLLLVVSQRLVPLADGSGRMALFERMNGEMIQSLLLNHTLPDTFQPLNQIIEEAYNHGLITADVAHSYQVETTFTL
ncbi:MAG: competence type IV pilus ATPase ComGA [Aerococcus sp.]|nr:competence type IV pilus ATPase ComGA [Aerococcus sp.]